MFECRFVLKERRKRKAKKKRITCMFDSRFVWKKRGEGRQRRRVEVSSSYTKDSSGATLYIGRDNVAVEKD